MMADGRYTILLSNMDNVNFDKKKVCDGNY